MFSMKKSRPFYVNICIFLCRFFSFLLAGIHFAAVQVLYLKIPACLRHAPGGIYKNLQKIWFARLLKKWISLWVRSPFRDHVLRLVRLDFDMPASGGLVFATCHTPWKRLLVKWFSENHYILIIDTAKSRERNSRIRKQRKGHNELSHIIRHLRSGGRVIIAADVFNQSTDHPTEILGKPGNLSLLPARLARIAGVPLMAALPRLCNGMIHISAGPIFDREIRQAEMGNLMKNLLAYFENEIRKDPSIWSYFVNDPLSQFHKKRIV
jgi:hypothetical protein